MAQQKLQDLRRTKYRELERLEARHRRERKVLEDELRQIDYAIHREAGKSGSGSWLRPREVARMRLLKSTGDSSTERSIQAFILREIREGRLKAVNHGKNPDRPYYLIHVDDIADYNKSN